MSLSPTLRPRRSLAIALAAVTAAALLVPLSASPAAAAPLRQGPYLDKPEPFHDSGEFDPECQGLDLRVRFTAHGVSSIRHVLGSGGQAFFAKDRVRLTETWSVAATGEVLFTVDGEWVYEEVAARRVAKSAVPRRLVPRRGLEGPIFEFTSVQTGGDVIRDESGQVLHWNGGQVEFANLFDTRGDHEPGGTSLRFRVVKKTGHLPLVDRDICEVAARHVP